MQRIISCGIGLHSGAEVAPPFLSAAARENSLQPLPFPLPLYLAFRRSVIPNRICFPLSPEKINNPVCSCSERQDSLETRSASNKITSTRSPQQDHLNEIGSTRFVSGPKAQIIPAWGKAPGAEPRKIQRAEGPFHPSPAPDRKALPERTGWRNLPSANLRRIDPNRRRIESRIRHSRTIVDTDHCLLSGS